jgi:hypothetical protein
LRKSPSVQGGPQGGPPEQGNPSVHQVAQGHRQEGLLGNEASVLQHVVEVMSVPALVLNGVNDPLQAAQDANPVLERTVQHSIEDRE